MGTVHCNQLQSLQRLLEARSGSLSSGTTVLGGPIHFMVSWGGGGCPAYYKTVSSFPGLCPLGAPRILSPPCSIWGKPKCFYVLSVLAGGGGGAKSSSFEHLWSRAFYHPPPSFFISWACLRMKSRSYLQDIIHAKYHLSFYALYFL